MSEGLYPRHGCLIDNLKDSILHHLNLNKIYIVSESKIIIIFEFFVMRNYTSSARSNRFRIKFTYCFGSIKNLLKCHYSYNAQSP